MHTFRTRFNKDIIAEFLPPVRKTKSIKVVILCSGMPTVPAKKSLVQFFSQKGYWTFYPRYRGSWESDGQFLKLSPHQDILDIINQLPKGFTDLWSNKKYRLDFKKLFLIGGSFGAPAQLLNSWDKRVDKIVSVSPVVDWLAPSKKERLNILFPFVRKAFGQGYRVTKKDWNKLSTGKFYNPVNFSEQMASEKILLIHASDDEVVSAKSVKHFAKITQSRLILLKTGGHLSTEIATTTRFWGRINKFLNS